MFCLKIAVSLDRNILKAYEVNFQSVVSYWYCFFKFFQIILSTFVYVTMLAKDSQPKTLDEELWLLALLSPTYISAQILIRNVNFFTPKFIL